MGLPREEQPAGWASDLQRPAVGGGGGRAWWWKVLGLGGYFRGAEVRLGLGGVETEVSGGTAETCCPGPVGLKRGRRRGREDRVPGRRRWSGVSFEDPGRAMSEAWRVFFFFPHSLKTLFWHIPPPPSSFWQPSACSLCLWLVSLFHGCRVWPEHLHFMTQDSSELVSRAEIWGPGWQGSRTQEWATYHGRCAWQRCCALRKMLSVQMNCFNEHCFSLKATVCIHLAN